MLSSKPNNEKVLKIFSSIRCLSKDQLPRYMEGRLTDVERHLVEQHLADCDLCYDALLALEKEGNTERYNDLTGKLQRYVQNSVQPVSHVQKVAQYTRKERNKENMLVYFWIVAFIGLGIGSVYVLRGHMRNQPPARVVAANVSTKEKDAVQTGNVAETTQVVAPVQGDGHPPPNTTAPGHKPAPNTTQPPVTPPAQRVDSAALKKAAALKAQQRRATADSLRRVALQQKQQDSIKKAATADKAAKEAAAKEKNNDDKKNDQPTETKSTPKEQAPSVETAKKDAPAPINSDEYLYKAAMVYQQQGNLGEAIDRYKRIESVSSGKYVEMARYQLAVCYRSKGQMGKARRMFREVVRMDGPLKNAAQQALDSL
jgi:tetratricopeptide (TPR) repeat protein